MSDAKSTSRLQQLFDSLHSLRARLICLPVEGLLPKQLRLDQIAVALRESWSLATSSKWLPDNPARGQCDVTALLVNELVGGEILKTPLPEGDHFYNRINGRRVDLTDSQFDQPIAYADLPSNRKEVMSATTLQQYEALRSAFRRRFADGGASDDRE